MLENLPEINFIDGSSQDVENRVIAKYEELANRKLASADPVKIFLKSIVSIIIQQRELINWTAKQNLLAYAEGDYLDNLGALVGVARLEASKASVSVKFNASNIERVFSINILAGTRVSAGDNINFVLRDNLVIASNESYVIGVCDCEVAGVAGNDYKIGQINMLVDPVAYLESIENINISSGGVDLEDDENYRERIYLAPEHFSVAGPAGAYKFWALSADQNIADVSVDGPEDEPGHVYIYVLMKNGELASDEMLDKIYNVLNADKVRPLCDIVHVENPEKINYNINLSYYILRDKATQAMQIQERVNQAINNYINWQREKIGRDINPSELIKLIMNAGASRVIINSPSYQELDFTEVANLNNTPVIVFGGLEDI